MTMLADVPRDLQAPSTDPATAAAVAFVPLAVAGLAAFVPARRAARVNPMTALRAEG